MTNPCIAIDGATSFTGYWFASTLAQQGFDVVAFCQRPRMDYSGLKAERLQRLPKNVRLVENASFGSTQHLEALRSLPALAVYARHGAYTDNYKSEDFALLTAVEHNTRSLPQVLILLKQHGAKLCLTGSVFQQGVGVAYPTARAFSPYGLSKTLTEQIITYQSEKYDVRLGVFMIANPFGPWEEARFTSYLAKAWLGGDTPHVQTPLYLRDNIPISLLALSYADYVQELIEGVNPLRLGPSCYAESQGQFTARFADAMRARLRVPCAFTLAENHPFVEPQIRLNTHPIDYTKFQWDEMAEWDRLAHWYQQQFPAKL